MAAAAAPTQFNATNTSGGAACYPVRQAVSNGVFHGDNPINFALPLLIIQIVVVLLVTRCIALLFKPLRQPRVLAEIIGGVMLGPSVLGRVGPMHMRAIFPENSVALLETVANLGLLFFLFIVGLELDLREIRRSGRVALLIAASGIAMPFAGGVGVANLLLQQQQQQQHQKPSSNSSSAGMQMGPLVVFLGVPLSITAFPVLMRIMAERKLLATEVGKMVVPAAALNDVFAWILLAIGVAISGSSSTSTSSAFTPAYILLAGLAFVLFMLFVVRRFMESIVSQHRSRSSAGSTQHPSTSPPISELHVALTLVGVLASGFATDAIGIHPLFGAFVFGLVVPNHGTFAQLCIEKIEDLVTLLMLPLFFASSGLKTDLGSIDSPRAVGILLLVVVIAAVGKISATTAVTAVALRLPLREALTFGFLMNTKGLVELIVLNIGKDLGVFDDQTFAILVLMCLILMFFTTPVVMALYKPARQPPPYKRRKLEAMKKEAELRVLACVHAARDVPPLLHLLDAFCCRQRRNYSSSKGGGLSSRVKLFAMHLMELSERPSAILSLSKSLSAAAAELEDLQQLKHESETKEKNEGDDTEAEASEMSETYDVDRNGDHYVNDSTVNDMMMPFETYGQMMPKVAVRLVSSVSSMADMHWDVCQTAASRRATFILLSHDREDGIIGRHLRLTKNHGFRAVNQKILQHAPCSVAVLVHRSRSPRSWPEEEEEEEGGAHVAVAFFGGADDREALAFGRRIAENGNARLTLFRFKQKLDDGDDAAEVHHVIDVDGGKSEQQQEKAEDEQAVQECVREQKFEYKEQWYGGGGWPCSAEEAVVAAAKASDITLLIVGGQSAAVEKSSELGRVGEALANAAPDMKASVLVVHQHKALKAPSASGVSIDV